MSLKDIISLLEKEAGAQRQEITSGAEKEAQRIISQARRESEERDAIAQNEHTHSIKAEEDRLIGRAELDRRATLAEARESLVSEVMAAAKIRLMEIPETPGYKVIFKRLAAEAVDEAACLSGDKIVFVNRRDTELAAETLCELDFDAEISSDGFEDAGIIVSSADKSRRLLNTFADRLELAAPIIKADVMTILFEK